MDDPRQCQWQMVVTDGTNSVEIGYPLTVEFNITRNTYASANNATFNIYNLSPSTRDSDFFFQDRFAIDKIKYVYFKAGYHDRLSFIFKGYILQSYSKRSSTNIITSMECLDMGSSNDYVNTTFEAGTTYRDAVENIILNSRNLTFGNMGLLEGAFQTPTTIEGTPLECLNAITGGHAFIDNGVVNILQDNEGIEATVTEIRADNGLIATPERREGQVDVRMIFNPEFVVGQWINIKSEVASRFTGTYKVCGISHQGTISGAVAGERTTTLNLLTGAFLPNSNYNVTNGKTGQPAQSVKGKEVKPLNGGIGNNAQAVYNYIKAHGGRVPNSRIIGTITWQDMLGHENTPDERIRELSPAICQNCITIATKLYNFKQAYTPNQPILISSGWRSRENNNKYKNAAKESAHLRGLAIDFRYTKINTYNTFKNIYKKQWDKFTYWYKANDGNYYIHVQATLGAGGAKRKRGQ